MKFTATTTIEEETMSVSDTSFNMKNHPCDDYIVTWQEAFQEHTDEKHIVHACPHCTNYFLARKPGAFSYPTSAFSRQTPCFFQYEGCRDRRLA
jgi:hypothetical protein